MIWSWITGAGSKINRRNPLAPRLDRAYSLNTMNAATKPAKMPRKGQFVTINGTRFEVLRRYCHGLHFDLRAVDGGALDCTSEASMFAGLAAGTITIG